MRQPREDKALNGLAELQTAADEARAAWEEAAVKASSLELKVRQQSRNLMLADGLLSDGVPAEAHAAAEQARRAATKAHRRYQQAAAEARRATMARRRGRAG